MKDIFGKLHEIGVRRTTIANIYNMALPDVCDLVEKYRSSKIVEKSGTAQQAKFYQNKQFRPARAGNIKEMAMASAEFLRLLMIEAGLLV